MYEKAYHVSCFPTRHPLNTQMLEWCFSSIFLFFTFLETFTAADSIASISSDLTWTPRFNLLTHRTTQCKREREKEARGYLSFMAPTLCVSARYHHVKRRLEFDLTEEPFVSTVEHVTALVVGSPPSLSIFDESKWQTGLFDGRDAFIFDDPLPLYRAGSVTTTLLCLLQVRQYDEDSLRAMAARQLGISALVADGVASGEREEGEVEQRHCGATCLTSVTHLIQLYVAEQKSGISFLRQGHITDSATPSPLWSLHPSPHCVNSSPSEETPLFLSRFPSRLSAEALLAMCSIAYLCYTFST